MRRKRLLHVVGTEFKRLQQVAMATSEVVEYVRQLAGRGIRIEIENALDDMVGAGLVGRVETARLGCELERAYDDARRVGTQIERVPIQKSGLRHLPSVGRSER